MKKLVERRRCFALDTNGTELGSDFMNKRGFRVLISYALAS